MGIKQRERRPKRALRATPQARRRRRLLKDMARAAAAGALAGALLLRKPQPHYTLQIAGPEDGHFSLPSQSDLDSLIPGVSQVKLLFEVADDGAFGVERMWVRITEIIGAPDSARPYLGILPTSYVGVLDNTPQCNVGIRLGDTVYFSAQHIIDVGDLKEKGEESDDSV